MTRSCTRFPMHRTCNTASFGIPAAFSILRRSFKSLGQRALGWCGVTTERYLRGPDRQITHRLVGHLFSGEAEVVDRDSKIRGWLTRHTRSRLCVAAVLLLLAAGCSSSRDEASSPSADEGGQSSTTTTVRSVSTTSTSSTSPSTSETASEPGEPSVEDEIVSRYIGYWDARFAANSGTPNPDDPAL